jgi:hypothetical protein
MSSKGREFHRENVMDNITQPQALRIFSVASILFGILGGAFYWWVPLGMVLSLTGLMLGVIDGAIARRRSFSFRLSIVGLLVSAAALSLCIVIYALNMQTVTFGGGR